MLKRFGVQDPSKAYIYRPGAYALMSVEGLVVLVKSPLGYFLIGGGIDPDEPAENCLMREALEEVGYDIEVQQALETVEEFVTVRGSQASYQKIMTAYRANLKSKRQEPIEEDHELVYLKKEEALELMYLEGQRYFVEKYFE